MKPFTTAMIILLLTLCHFVDIESRKNSDYPTENSKKNNRPAIESKTFNDIEYEKTVIESLRTDTVYYSYKNTVPAEIYDDLN
ncbi:hypothetical protein [Labilibaculum euxinus]|uniref:Uncharacterized protein n=1 Tax=Labilibaculum euxinus TaxID=2686357 RepID=A0A7M4DAP7_9BACT|nr:hypothetical protein [Labilibaculum euxinus]MUP39726.1 hypothetical protein [Labilibaculum euxinus]MVB08931.1 hypothetical protein [Labilibaculum euxinus]